MNPFTKLLALAAIAAALAIAGCGGDDDDDGDTGATGATGVSGATLPADEWVAEADQLCREGDKDQTAEAQAYFEDQGIDPSTLDNDSPEVEGFISEVLVPNIEQQIDAVEALGLPEGEEDEAQEFLEQANSDLDALAEDPSLGAGQGNPFAETNELAKDLGLKVCAS